MIKSLYFGIVLAIASCHALIAGEPLLIQEGFGLQSGTDGVPGDLPERGIWEMEYDVVLDGRLEETRTHALVLSTANVRIMGHYENHFADGQDNDSIFTGSLLTGPVPIVTLQQDDRPHYTAFYSGRLVEPGRVVGSYADNHGHAGDWALTLVTESRVEPFRAEPPQEDLIRSVLGTYGKAIRGERFPYVNLRPPNRNLWTEKISQAIEEELDYGEVDYIGTALLVIPETGKHRIEIPGAGVEFRINGQRFNDGVLDLKKGVYRIEIYTNHWGQPYLTYAQVTVRRSDTNEEVPFVNTESDIRAFLAQRIDGRPVKEVCTFETIEATEDH